jgi:hypothetical protein
MSYHICHVILSHVISHMTYIKLSISCSISYVIHIWCHMCLYYCLGIVSVVLYHVASIILYIAGAIYMVSYMHALLLSYLIIWYVSISVAISPVSCVKVPLQRYFRHVISPVPSILQYTFFCLSYDIFQVSYLW